MCERGDNKAVIIHLIMHYLPATENYMHKWYSNRHHSQMKLRKYCNNKILTNSGHINENSVGFGLKCLENKLFAVFCMFLGKHFVTFFMEDGCYSVFGAHSKASKKH